MKNMVIGSVFSICGMMLFSAILIAGAVFSTTVDSWSGSKFWYSILSKSSPEQGMHAMGLSFFFYLSIVLFLIGFFILLWEFIVKLFNKLD